MVLGMEVGAGVVWQGLCGLVVVLVLVIVIVASDKTSRQDSNVSLDLSFATMALSMGHFESSYQPLALPVLYLWLSVALDYHLAHASSSEAFIIVTSIDGAGPQENQWHWRSVNGPVRPEGRDVSDATRI
jgi:hypothetical protein